MHVVYEDNRPLLGFARVLNSLFRVTMLPVAGVDVPTSEGELLFLRDFRDLTIGGTVGRTQEVRGRAERLFDGLIGFGVVLFQGLAAVRLQVGILLDVARSI